MYRGQVSGPIPRVGWGFISLYTLAFISTSLLFLAPLLVTLALKVNSLVGIEQAPKSLAVVTGIAALVAVLPRNIYAKLGVNNRRAAVRQAAELNLLSRARDR